MTSKSLPGWRIGSFPFARLLAAVLVATALVIGWRRVGTAPGVSLDAAPVSFVGTTMGGTWSVKLWRMPPSANRDALQASIGSLLDRLDCQMSIWKPESDLSRFNRYRGDDWFPVPADVAQVVDEARRISEQTDGTFDVTVGPLVLLWGFGSRAVGLREKRVPPDDAINAAKSHVDYRRLECRPLPPSLRKHDPDIYVDLGGIAKGYAAQAVASLLESAGITDYLIAVGGELRAKGVSQNGHPWRVGIETPTSDVRRIFRSLDLRDASLSTSGDYRNFFDVDSRR